MENTALLKLLDRLPILCSPKQFREVTGLNRYLMAKLLKRWQGTPLLAGNYRTGEATSNLFA